MRETDINVTTHMHLNIFVQKDIRGEIESTRNNPDMMGTSTRQQALTNGGATLEGVLTSTIRGTALRQEGSELRTEGVQVENNTRGDMDRTLNKEQEHLPDTIGRTGLRSHQPWSMGIANVGSPNVDQEMMDDNQDTIPQITKKNK